MDIPKEMLPCKVIYGVKEFDRNISARRYVCLNGIDINDPQSIDYAAEEIAVDFYRSSHPARSMALWPLTFTLWVDDKIVGVRKVSLSLEPRCKVESREES